MRDDHLFSKNRNQGLRPCKQGFPRLGRRTFVESGFLQSAACKQMPVPTGDEIKIIPLVEHHRLEQPWLRLEQQNLAADRPNFQRCRMLGQKPPAPCSRGNNILPCGMTLARHGTDELDMPPLDLPAGNFGMLDDFTAKRLHRLYQRLQQTRIPYLAYFGQPERGCIAHERRGYLPGLDLLHWYGVTCTPARGQKHPATLIKRPRFDIGLGGRTGQHQHAAGLIFRIDARFRLQRFNKSRKQMSTKLCKLCNRFRIIPWQQRREYAGACPGCFLTAKVALKYGNCHARTQ